MFESFEDVGEYKPDPRPPLLPAREVTATTLEGLNLDEELLHQYKLAVRLIEEAKDNVEIGLNQKAQMLGSINTIISAIARTKTDLYNAERMKILEATLIQTLKQFPEINTKFLEVYEERLQAAGFSS